MISKQIIAQPPLAFGATAGAVLIGSLITTMATDKQLVMKDTKRVAFVVGTRSHSYGSHEHLAGRKNIFIKPV